VGTCVNLSGICVLDAYNNNTMYFRGIDSGDASILSVALNATNHTIVLTVNVNALTAALPQATTTQQGVGETATDAEAQGKASTTVFLTPSNLAALPSSEVFAGLIEVATQAEANLGVSDTVAITPLKLVTYLTQQTNLPALWTDTVARNALVPNVTGQLGSETTSGMSYTAYGTSAGNWNQNFQLGTTAQAPNNQVGFNTTITFNSGAFLVFTGSGSVAFESDAVFQGHVDLGYNTLARLFNNSVIVPASSVLTTSSTAGQFNSLLINTFASLNNVNTGWTGFTNSAVRKTGDCNTITLPQLAQVVDTLINLLKTPQLPAT
jgi:hypothetical protein